MSTTSTEKTSTSIFIPVDSNAAKSPIITRKMSVVPNLSLTWKNVSYTVPIGNKGERRRLLDNVSGGVSNGELVAIMGGSGAGKSTLLNCLAGRIPDQNGSELTGEILLNGHARNKRTWIKTCAYVEQDDLMFSNLSVEETLTYAANLRLPQTMSKSEKTERVNEIIMQLGLNSCRRTWIGDATSRGISGGERKRVSIGIELITEPQILFLDEPTSGLDASTALNIISTIQKIAQERRMVVLMTIHQPRTDILELFNRIILMTVGGRLVWNGQTNEALAHFSKLKYPLPDKTNPSDHFLDIVTLDQRTSELNALSTQRINTFCDAWNEISKSQTDVVHSSSDNKASDSSESMIWTNSWFYEFGLLFQRNMVDVFRSKATIGATIGQAFFYIILLGIIFYQLPLDTSGQQSRFGFLFFIVINQSFGVVMPLIGVFPVARAIFKRERSSGAYRATTAYFAKILSALPLTWANAIILSVGLYWFVGLQNAASNFFFFLLTVLVHSTAMLSLGFLVGSAVPTATVGQILAPLIIGVFLLFAGQLVNVGSVTWAFRWIQYISALSYSFKALVQNEYSGLVFNLCSTSYNGSIVCITKTGDSFIIDYALDSPSKWICIVINICIIIAFLIIGFLFFQRTTRPLQRLI